MKLKQVTKEEFIDFIKNYPKKLETDIYAISELPLITYNDFSIADKWPDSVVASTFAYGNNPDDYYYVPENERVYKIAEEDNHNA